LQELSFAGTILCRNYPLQELPFAGTILAGTIYFYNCSLPAIIFISHRLDPVSFEHLVLAPLCEPKSHHIIAVCKKVPIKKLEKCIELISKYFRYFQIFLGNI